MLKSMAKSLIYNSFYVRREPASATPTR